MREPEQRGIYFDLKGDRIIGTLFTGGPGPRPTVIVLHGMPGVEKNYDLMYELRRRGYNSLLFHFRGTWGSGGAWTFTGTADDTVAALDHLGSPEYADVVDMGNIALIGHSMGGWAAVVAGTDPRVAAVCASAAVVDAESVPISEADAVENFTPFIQGITPAEFARTWRELPSSLEAAARLEKPLLVVHGAADSVVPVSQGEILYGAASEPKELQIHPEADHAFINEREWWIGTIVEWLGRVLAEPA